MLRSLRTAGACLLISLYCGVSPSSADTPKTDAKAPKLKALGAILVEADTGQVLYEKEADTPRPNASTTKIMTSILLLERTKPTDRIVASRRASVVDGSSLNLADGETISAHDMLYALMLRSANDGCTATAEHISGSVESFVELMNRRAQELGALRTTFRNPHGLNAPGHQSTPRDLARLARYASKFPEFNAATRTKYHSILRSTGSKDIVLKNHAKFLWRYTGADGVKTGYTVPAGRCFVGGATRNGRRLISVVLNSPDIVGETAQLMDYGFKHFERVRLARADQVLTKAPVLFGSPESVPARALSDFWVTLPKGASQRAELKVVPDQKSAPVADGADIGMIAALVDGRPVATMRLVAAIGSARRVPPKPPAPVGRNVVVAALMGAVTVGYATATSKAARGSRHRVQTFLRDYYRGGPRYR
jgi:D-alanyl-D-alanine carboxypeptidase (penicillin-binding protein 5/6)